MDSDRGGRWSVGSGKVIGGAEVCIWGLGRGKGVWRCEESAEWVRKWKVLAACWKKRKVMDGWQKCGKKK